MKDMEEAVISKMRLSNFELLRIAAMMFVMLGHSHLRMRAFDSGELSLMSILKTTSACVVTMGVGIFITISGWFGIKFKVSGLFNYLFQVMFVLWAIYGVAIALNVTSFNVDGIKTSMGLYDGYWFIIGYLGLYLISPILNMFIEDASKKEYQLVMFLMIIFQCCYSWITSWFDYYNGYSIILFSIIYLTAAYFRKYPIGWVDKWAPLLFVLTVLVMACISTFSLWRFGHAARQIRDDNPFVILACIFLLLSFKKLKFRSRIVNWLAASCFTVYLIHYNPYVYPYFMSIITSIYGQYSGFVYGIMLVLTLAAVYLICTFFDQLRVFAWHGVMTLWKKTQ